MKTKVVKKRPSEVCPGVRIVNDDGFVWETEYPKDDYKKYKYKAEIPDSRLAHFDFENHGYHLSWADTIDELINDIKAFAVPYYSDEDFLRLLREKDAEDVRSDRQVELWWDSRGAHVKRGQLTFNNMTEYTSL